MAGPSGPAGPERERRERVAHQAERPEVPGCEVDGGHAAGVQDRPLLRQVLAGREPGRVEPLVDELLLGLLAHCLQKRAFFFLQILLTVCALRCGARRG